MRSVVFDTHATSVDNESGLASGWFDAPLSATGETQARELGARRRDDRFEAVFCSDLTRRPAVEIEQRRAHHPVHPFPNGESYQDVVARVSAWLRETGTQHDGGTVLVIGHRATFYALEHLLNHVTLDHAVTAPWTWQPEWVYHLP